LCEPILCGCRVVANLNGRFSHNWILSEREVTFGFLLSQIRQSPVVCKVHAPYSRVENVGNSSSPFCTLAVLWPPYKNCIDIVPGNPCVGALNVRGVAKYSDGEGGSVEGYNRLCHVWVSHFLMSFLFKFTISPDEMSSEEVLRPTEKDEMCLY